MSLMAQNSFIKIENNSKQMRWNFWWLTWRLHAWHSLASSCHHS